ncbi:divalent-cation tolerance protein CutA [Algiphilus sp.]|uniref:divalent-cation tolerance protein CutA n=1 Tax=Algiphilus sp. TaxID=1872431 RepID=UPI001CA61183|nr:divalent-cation tolerance protein CutA [Algiphilus sp.]MBY8965929.1 divalent-cation tolerance protein CutA [Algiphilus acroporae]MCI5062454.1 divalent-cation tolerance protein CutA [Algiphilus sp.]MCI5104799.1 divalent-cation tolerance protein CutA [Algiphilus sp.]
MSEPLVVLVTAPESEAPALASALVERRVAACVNILPAVQSVFLWQGRVDREQESLLICKTPHDGYAAFEAALLELHSYEVPECIALEAHQAHAAYAQWVVDSTRIGTE